MAATGSVTTPPYQCPQFSFLIDAVHYYRAVAEACEQAQESIYILGWDVDSRIALRREPEWKDENLGHFLDRLAREKPHLNIYILEWDFALFYSLEREAWSLFSLGWLSHERVHFALDDNHPLGGSQHQKIVVIDDQIAFTGGIDLAAFRWDTSDHRPNNPLRIDNETPYGPVHDVQVAVSGAAAKALGHLARQRWLRATGDELTEPADTAAKPWPESIDCDPARRPGSVFTRRNQPTRGARNNVK